MSSHDDFATEPVPGLPGQPPEGERILWQGRPDAWALTRRALSFWWVSGYFALLAGWQFLSVLDRMTVWAAFGASVPFLILWGVVAALLLITGHIQARTTLYTVTNRRIAMRIGAALTVTLNLPYRQIGRMDLDLRRDGTGTIAMATLGDTRLGYLMCWPHLRPWKLPCQPALRCIPDARSVAEIIAEAAEARVSEPQIARGPAPVPVAAE